MKILEPAGLILILVLVIILFGPRRFPDFVKPFRRRMKVFRDDETRAPSTLGGKASDSSAEDADRDAESLSAGDEDAARAGKTDEEERR